MAPVFVASVGRGIAMTTVTTVGSVAMLLFTNHPGSVGVLLMVGLPLCLLASVSVLPACVVLPHGRKRASR